MHTCVLFVSVPAKVTGVSVFLSVYASQPSPYYRKFLMLTFSYNKSCIFVKIVQQKLYIVHVLMMIIFLTRHVYTH